MASIKASENICAGEIVLVAGILQLIGNILQCIYILLLGARCLPLGKDLGPLRFEFDVRSSLGKCAVGVSLLKYSSELPTLLFPLSIVDDAVGVGITHEI